MNILHYELHEMNGSNYNNKKCTIGSIIGRGIKLIVYTPCQKNLICCGKQLTTYKARIKHDQEMERYITDVWASGLSNQFRTESNSRTVRALRPRTNAKRHFAVTLDGNSFKV